jgi:hypothetical protein
MKRIICHALFAFAGVLISSSLSAQVNQTFNTNYQAPNVSDIKGFLQDHCWMFTAMDANANGWNPGIEGDAAFVSNATGEGTQVSSMYTPVLQVGGSVAINFNYEFNADITNISWLNIYLTDHNNNVILHVHDIQLKHKKGNTLYNFNETFTNLPSGAYKILLEYEIYGEQEIAIDQLQINVPYVYPGGCNTAPIAVNDVITGNSNRTATGNVKLNDSDPNGDYFNTYLITNSPDGTVVLNSSGAFTFTPNPGFNGNSTVFTYQVCDAGFGPACGNTAVVTINFAAGMLPVKLADFTVSVNDASDVSVRWATNFEQGSSHFEVERSFDGVNFEKVGTVKAAGTSMSRKDYSFLDRLRNSVTNKKDVYYRLRLVDINSRAEVSKVLVLRLFKTSTLKMVSITPNPVLNDINVQVQLKQDSYVVMKVTSNNGVEVARRSIRGSEGLNVFSLDGTSKLQPGIYMLEVIINSNERMSIKLVKN